MVATQDGLVGTEMQYYLESRWDGEWGLGSLGVSPRGLRKGSQGLPLSEMCFIWVPCNFFPPTKTFRFILSLKKP